MGLSCSRGTPVLDSQQVALPATSESESEVISFNDDEIYDEVPVPESPAANQNSDPVKVRFGSASISGYDPTCSQKQSQDDLVCLNSGSSNSVSIFAVFDGHGPSGHHVASYCARNFSKLLLASPLLSSRPGLAVSSAFQKLDVGLTKADINIQLSGTSAAAAVLNKHELFTANVGNCRCVLGRRTHSNSVTQHGSASYSYEALELSIDHTPERADERQRILKAGGVLRPVQSQTKDNFVGPLRVWLPARHIPGLPLSRSLGDSYARTVGVIADPEVQHTRLALSDEFVIIATDGVWEFVSSDDAVEIVASQSNPQDGAKWLVREAASRWEESGDGICDDISAIVLHLTYLEPH